jgi:arylsulfatase A-like enzyme
VLRKIFDSPWFYFALAILLAVGGVLSQFRRTVVEAPSGGLEEVLPRDGQRDFNVLFILIDTLRADRLSSYGYARETSPNIDALAGRGIRFAHVESQSSWTKASMASLWTGLYPQRTGVMRFPHALPAEAVMPAEVFKEAGYRTAGIWRNGWVANNFGFDQGFDLYYRPNKNRPVANVKRNNPSAHALVGTDLDSTESASEFILGAGGEPFFLYVHFMDVHQYLYADSSPEYGSGFSDIYDSAIHWTDQNVGMLVEVLANAGLLDKTWIIIAADHGEAFFEHGGEGHATNLYGEVTQVPLIIAPPIALDPPIVIEERVANVDIWPTVLDLVGLPPLPNVEGRSLVPLILEAAGLGVAPEDLRDRTLFSQLDRSWGNDKRDPDPMISVIKDDFRMLYRQSRPGKVEMYDKASDPAEQKNVAADQSERAVTLSKEIDAFLQPPIAWGETPTIEIDAMREAQLRALGYVVHATPKRDPDKPEEQKTTQPRKKWGDD